jgi:hypothetical protein
MPSPDHNDATTGCFDAFDVMQEVVSLLNGVDVPDFLTLKTFLMKSLGACASVAASLPLGYQGVLLHIGGMIASLLASRLPRFDLTCGAKRAPNTNNKRRLDRCMTMVKRGTRFAEYSSEAVLPFTSLSRSIPRFVEGLTRRLPGTRLARYWGFNCRRLITWLKLIAAV